MPFFGVPIRNGLPIGLGSVAGFGVQQFDPSLLFEGGTVAGAWYDPSDLSTMFDSSDGTTPVAMPGQGAAVPVGLMLDKSQGLVLGPELVTNGDFSGGSTGWTLGVGWSVAGGAATHAAGTSSAINQTGAITAGRTYVCTVTVSGRTSGSWYWRLGNTTNLEISSSNGTFTKYITGAATGNYIGIFGDATFDGTIDNISVRELPGNHAIAFNNTTARPELRARVNLLTYSEEFDQGVWVKTNLNAFGSGSVANTTATTDPLGGNTADFIQEDNTPNVHGVQANSALASAITNTFSVYVKAGTRSWVALRVDGVSSYFDLSNGQKGTIGSGVTADILPVGNGWYRCAVTKTWLANNNVWVRIATGDGVDNYTGDGTSGIYIWGADLRPANIGANVPAYQRIADANTYDTSGFPLYLRFDGIDDSMYTPANLNLSGTDKVSVFAGVRKLSDAVNQRIVELSADTSTNPGTFQVIPVGWSGTGPNYAYSQRGTAALGLAMAAISPSSYAAPLTNIVTGFGDIAGDNSTLRINSAQVAVATGDQGAGNFGTYPLFIGARNNSSLWFNGHLHSLIIAGSAVSAGNISSTEQWVAGKTGISIFNDGPSITLNFDGQTYQVWEI